MAPLGLYIHIPFCHARCGYCDFVTFTGKEDQRERYVKALCEEIGMYGRKSPSFELLPLKKGGGEGFRRTAKSPLAPLFQRGEENKEVCFSTVFLGGGTPSVLDPSHIQTLFKALREKVRIDADSEITLEANPESITAERLSAWKEVGINRVSIGLQAYDDALLKAMGRLHTTQEFRQAYDLARRADFSNINVDLIYGFPGQTLEGWRHTLQATAAMDPEHISTYSLTIEEHTPFAAEGHTINTDLQAAMYAAARSYLAGQVFEQYEISNFAKPGYACQHNLIYWRGQDYLGVGVGAVGRVGDTRWQNHKSFGPYYKDLDAGQFPRTSEERLSPVTRKFERLMLGLRLREGYAWGAETNPLWLDERTRLAGLGQLEEINPGIWRIPDSYVPLTNQILLPFL